MTAETSLDGFLDNRLKIHQPKKGAHRAGLDALLLAASLPAGAKGKLLDLGAGVGVAGLAAACRLPDVHVTLVERDTLAAGLARLNCAENSGVIGKRATVVEADILAGPQALANAGLAAHAADFVIFNPPFHPADRTRPSSAAARADAHRIEPDDLVRWMKAAAGLLHPGGLMAMIYRADELPRLLSAIGSRFGSLKLLPVHPHRYAAATRIIVVGRPQGRAPLTLLPGLVLHEDDGKWREQVDHILRGVAGLDFGS